MDVPSCRSKGQIRYSPLLTPKAKDDFITASFEMSNALSSKKFLERAMFMGLSMVTMDTNIGHCTNYEVLKLKVTAVTPS